MFNLLLGNFLCNLFTLLQRYDLFLEQSDIITWMIEEVKDSEIGWELLVTSRKEIDTTNKIFEKSATEK